ncbi:MAG: PAS domain S-box protein [Opitutales bacterium]
MGNESRTREDLLQELERLRRQVARLEDRESRRAEAEKALRSSQESFQRVLEKTPVGICITDSNGYFEYTNPAYRAFYGYEAEELLGNHFTMMVREDHYEILTKLHDDFIEGGTEMRGEWEVRTRSGEYKTILADAALIEEPDGDRKKVTFVMDITDRIHAERLRKELERIARHDLKTPLTAILTLPDLLIESPRLNDQEREMASVMRNSALKMLDLINISLETYKMEEGSYILQRDRIDFLDIFREVLSELQHLVENDELQLVFTLDGQEVELPKASLLVDVDPLLCHSLVGNLIKNAIEASPTGGKIEVSLQSGEPFVFEVSNDGVVPEEIRDRFFEKFVTSGGGNRTGLGTYSAQLIAKTHGGSIDMATAESQGTTLKVTLPGAKTES